MPASRVEGMAHRTGFEPATPFGTRVKAWRLCQFVYRCMVPRPGFDTWDLPLATGALPELP